MIIVQTLRSCALSSLLSRAVIGQPAMRHSYGVSLVGRQWPVFWMFTIKSGLEAIKLEYSDSK